MVGEGDYLFGLFRDFKDQTCLTEPKVFCRNVAIQEYVDALPDPNGQGDHAVGPRHSIQATDEVGEVVQDTQIMLHHDHIPSKKHAVITINEQKQPQLSLTCYQK